VVFVLHCDKDFRRGLRGMSTACGARWVRLRARPVGDQASITKRSGRKNREKRKLEDFFGNRKRAIFALLFGIPLQPTQRTPSGVLFALVAMKRCLAT